MTDKRRWNDKALGMDRPIDRRDFLNGVAVTVGALGAGALSDVARAADAAGWPQDQAGYYPPLLTGLRGSHPGSFENAHALRDGDFWDNHAALTDTGERYDLVIVGGGISGLSAAHFYRAARPAARILILDNHDDFGGHAKRNEYHLDGKLHLMNGGTLEIDSPTPYSPEAAGLLKTLGIDPVALAKACDQPDLYSSLGMGAGMVFDRETFGEDRLVAGMPREKGSTDAAKADPVAAWRAFLAKTPLSPQGQSDVLKIETGRIDYMPGLTSAQKKDALSRISYRDYLIKMVKVGPEALALYQHVTDGE